MPLHVPGTSAAEVLRSPIITWEQCAARQGLASTEPPGGRFVSSGGSTCCASLHPTRACKRAFCGTSLCGPEDASGSCDATPFAPVGRGGVDASSNNCWSDCQNFGDLYFGGVCGSRFCGGGLCCRAGGAEIQSFLTADPGCAKLGCDGYSCCTKVDAETAPVLHEGAECEEQCGAGDPACGTGFCGAGGFCCRSAAGGCLPRRARTRAPPASDASKRCPPPPFRAGTRARPSSWTRAAAPAATGGTAARR